MSNFGFTKLRLVKPYEAAFREARSAIRAHYILEQATVYDDLSEAIGDCSLVVGSTAVGHRDLHLPLYRLEAAAQIIGTHLESSPAALLFGSEKFGLSNEQMSFCHWLLRIPTREAHGSMNLGQAVAICLYELSRSDASASDRFAGPDRLLASESDRMTALLTEALRLSGYVGDRTHNSAELKIRRLVRRLGIASSDAESWLGILRQILWKLKNQDRN